MSIRMCVEEQARPGRNYKKGEAQWKAVKGVYSWVWEVYPLRLKAQKIKYPEFLPRCSSKFA